MKLKVLSKYLIIFATVAVFISSAQAREVKVYLDDEIKPVILKLIYEADEQIDIEMYILTEQDIIRALEKAEGRGVEVRIILDPNQRYNLKHVDRLKREGVEIKWYPVNKPSLMHRKLAIFDKEKVFLGSANWSRNGLTNNKEMNVVIDDSEVVEEVTEVFSDDWYYSFLGHYDKY
jgi:phosphatidylserine/phosphatidylglycerophosphate/cardiolipin synthase-like enzyme